MQPSKKDDSLPPPQLTVQPVRITVEGISLPSGAMVAVELACPCTRWAVTHGEGNDIEIVSMHEDEEAAESAKRRLRSPLSAAGRQAWRKLQ